MDKLEKVTEDRTTIQWARNSAVKVCIVNGAFYWAKYFRDRYDGRSSVSIQKLDELLELKQCVDAAVRELKRRGLV